VPETPFGFWIFSPSLTFFGGELEPLNEYAERIRDVEASDRCADGWCYPPLVEVESVVSNRNVVVPVERFELPSTHRIAATEPWGDDEYLDFAIALAGMLCGMRLVREGWGHFHEIPIGSTGVLADLHVRPFEIAEVLDAGSRWWSTASTIERRRMFGAIHWLCFSVSYDYEFDAFAARYTVIDTLWSIHESRTAVVGRAHAERPSILAAAYGLELPPWGVVTSSGRRKTCPLAELRNELIHEARFSGEPIGFAVPTEYEPSLSHQLSSFAMRLILSMLNVDAGFVGSSMSGMTRWLDLNRRSPTATAKAG